MILNVLIDNHTYPIEVPESMIREGEEFFARMDQDMDRGYQMSRTWVAAPNQVQRCQIVADKLLTALEAENQKLGMLMAAYILARMPGCQAVEMNLEGDMTEHDLKLGMPG